MVGADDGMGDAPRKAIREEEMNRKGKAVKYFYSVCGVLVYTRSAEARGPSPSR